MTTALTDNRLAGIYSTVGGSSAAAVVGKSPWKSPQEQNRVMRDVLHRGIVPADIDTPDTRRGRLLEPVAVQLLAESLEMPVQPWKAGAFRNPLQPWAHVNPDATIEDKKIVELKVPRPQTWDRLRMHGVPENYILQCQHTMAVMEVPVVLFAAMCPVRLEFVTVEIQRDDRLIRDLMDLEREFYDRVLADVDEPGDEAQIEVAPVATPGQIITLTDPAAVRAAETYLWCKGMVDEATELVEDAKLRLVGLMGGADAGEVPGVGRFYNREQTGRKTFDKAALAKAHPEIDLSKFEKTGAPFRAFRAYDLRRKGE